MSEPALIAVLLVWVTIWLALSAWANGEYAMAKAEFRKECRERHGSTTVTIGELVKEWRNRELAADNPFRGSESHGYQLRRRVQMKYRQLCSAVGIGGLVTIIITVLLMAR